MQRNFFAWSQRDAAEEKAEKRLKNRNVRKSSCVRKIPYTVADFEMQETTYKGRRETSRRQGYPQLSVSKETGTPVPQLQGTDSSSHLSEPGSGFFLQLS